MDGSEWEALPAEEKRRELFRRQKALLDTFLENGAISPAQYAKSFGDLKTKMGMGEDDAPSSRK